MREMKDSGINWLGKMPSHWSIHRNKEIFRNVSVKNHGDATVLSLYRELGVVPKDSRDDNHNVTSLDTDSYKYVEPGDLVINKMKAWSGSLGVSKYEGIVSPAYYVCKVDYSKTTPRFIHHYLRNLGIVEAYEMYSAGMRIGQWDLGIDDFMGIEIALPPLEEQEQISNTIDACISKIDVLIANQQAQIEKLKQYKQSLITEVVTKGLDPNAPMKDSGNDWFPRIPLNAVISRTGRHFDIILGKMLCSAPIDSTYSLEKYYCAADVHFDGISDGERKQMWFSPEEKSTYSVKVGDLLVVEGGAGAGGCAIVKVQDEDVYVQNSIMIVRPKEEMDNRYLRYLLEVIIHRGYIDVVCNKATIPHFTKEKLSNVPFIVADIRAQKETADYLDKKVEQINRVIQFKQSKIEKLNSIKKSMIYEYVTGKKEVSASNG